MLVQCLQESGDLTLWAQAVDLTKLPVLRSQRGLTARGPDK